MGSDKKSPTLSAADTSLNVAPTENVEEGDAYNVVSSTGSSTTTVTSEMTIPTEPSSFVVVPSLNDEPRSASVSTLYHKLNASLTDTSQAMNHGELITYFANILHDEQKAPCPLAVLERGLNILAIISEEWAATDVAPNYKLIHILDVTIDKLSESDTKTLYRTLSALSRCDSWLELEYCGHLFEISTVLWALQVGIQKLALGWESGETIVETMYRVEGLHLGTRLNILRHREALISLARGFRKWGVKVRTLVEADEEAVMESVDLST